MNPRYLLILSMLAVSAAAALAADEPATAPGPTTTEIRYEKGAMLRRLAWSKEQYEQDLVAKSFPAGGYRSGIVVVVRQPDQTPPLQEVNPEEYGLNAADLEKRFIAPLAGANGDQLSDEDRRKWVGLMTDFAVEQSANKAFRKAGMTPLFVIEDRVSWGSLALRALAVVGLLVVLVLIFRSSFKGHDPGA